MIFILIFGPSAVGKMTVGRELEKMTELKLFHNHMTIDLVIPFFEFGSPSFNRLVSCFRRQMFMEIAKNNLKGLIFTYVWEFNQKSDTKFVDSVIEIFRQRGARIYYVELEADIEERLKRNKTISRLEYKHTKKDIKTSEKILLEENEKSVLNTKEKKNRRFQKDNYIKVNNTNLSPRVVAKLIKSKFDL